MGPSMVFQVGSLVTVAVLPSAYSTSICSKTRGEWPYRSRPGSQYHPLPSMTPSALRPLFSWSVTSWVTYKTRLS